MQFNVLSNAGADSRTEAPVIYELPVPQDFEADLDVAADRRHYWAASNVDPADLNVCRPIRGVLQDEFLP